MKNDILLKHFEYSKKLNENFISVCLYVERCTLHRKLAVLKVSYSQNLTIKKDDGVTSFSFQTDMITSYSDGGQGDDVQRKFEKRKGDEPGEKSIPPKQTTRKVQTPPQFLPPSSCVFKKSDRQSGRQAKILFKRERPNLQSRGKSTSIDPPEGAETVNVAFLKQCLWIVLSSGLVQIKSRK